MNDGQNLVSILLSPPVLLTFIVCAALAGVVIWLVHTWQRRRHDADLEEQRRQQEATIARVLDSVAQDKDNLIAEYEARLRERDARIATLEQEVSRLRERLSSTGLLGLFGGRQREVIGALLLENEQLHEILAAKQEELRDLMSDMMNKLMARIEEQARENARAVRYKQALLSAFLQREEAQHLFDKMIPQIQGEGEKPPELPNT